MRKTYQALLAVAAMAALASTPARADTVALVDGGGWNVFYFGDTVFSPDWQTLGGDDIDYTFTLTQSRYLRVTDGYNDGDQFQVNINGVLSDTSLPVFTGNNIFDNWTSVFTDASIGATYSHATYLLGPGSYDVTGLAIQSPFGAGAAAIELGAVDGLAGGVGNGVPEPATWAMMLMGFGGLGALLRRRRASAIAA
jgi:hypothetical protein